MEIVGKTSLPLSLPLYHRRRDLTRYRWGLRICGGTPGQDWGISTLNRVSWTKSAFLQRTVQSCRDHGPRVFQFHAAADAVGAARPACVDQVDARVVMFNPFAEHAGVNIRIQRHERFAEERRGRSESVR